MGKGEKKNNVEKPSVCKPFKNVTECLMCARHCAQTYEEMGMNKTETLGWLSGSVG